MAKQPKTAPAYFEVSECVADAFEHGELLGETCEGAVFLIGGRLLFRRERECKRCRAHFIAIRRGRRGRFTEICDTCRNPPPKKRGPKRKGGEYVQRSGYVISSPIEDGERSFPTSRRSGQIMRSHLVWNRANPDDLVQPGDHVHHKNRDKTDDRLQNLEKLSAADHHAEHMDEMRGRLHVVVDQVCIECVTSFRGRYASKFCSDKCARQRRNREKREQRAESLHPCDVCKTPIRLGAKYCKAIECQRVKNRRKHQTWMAKKRSTTSAPASVRSNRSQSGGKKRRSGTARR